ncbi:MAG: cytochrome c3 family protein, partial [Planctomycetota bacterium]
MSESVNARVWRKLRWFLLRAAALAGAFVLLVALMTACAGWYTSRPEFCRSCHIMEPYYVSWVESSHSHVSCIKCHFPPGVGEKVRGKMLGLVQLAKYATASEGPRPAAEIPDASCLRSGCHETRLLAGRVEFLGISFDHRPHLENPRRGKELRCTSCHSQIVQGKHMTVTTSTCFLCHFKEGHFNEGLGACTRCHQIPEESFDLGGGVTFNHDLAYERGVDCTNCHGDLIRGNGEVPHERCGVCHNREDDLKRIDDHEFLHQTHVTDHKIDCLECHLEIQHSLDEDKMRHAASDCTSCHPDHHREQVNMLQGRGGKTIPDDAGGMQVVRIACPSCHQVKEISSTGTVLWKASIEKCTECHDDDATAKLQADYETLGASLSAVESDAARVRAALESAGLLDDRLSAIAAQLQQCQDDLDFLRVGNGIHNIHYARTLTRGVVERLSSL